MASWAGEAAQRLRTLAGFRSQHPNALPAIGNPGSRESDALPLLASMGTRHMGGVHIYTHRQNTRTHKLF